MNASVSSSSPESFQTRRKNLRELADELQGQNLNNHIYNPRSRCLVWEDMGGNVINCVSCHVTTTMVIEFIKIVLKSLCQQVL